MESADIQDNKGWKQEGFNNNTQIWYKTIPGTKNISIKLETKFDKPLMNLLTLIYETELFTEWVMFCSQSHTMKKVQKAQKVVDLKFKLPIISDRVAYLDGIGVDRLDKNGSIVIFTQSIQEDTQFLKQNNITIPNNNDVAVDMKFFYGEIKPIDRKHTLFKGLCNIDPKVNFLPNWVLNFFVRKVGSYMMNRLINLAQDIKGTQWEKNMNKPENKEFYEWMQNRVENFYKSKNL